jgi:hypothetical protein
MTSDLVQMVASIPWFGWVAIVAIVCGCLTGVVKMKFEHAERMEMIRHGINPDTSKPPEEREV